MRATATLKIAKITLSAGLLSLSILSFAIVGLAASPSQSKPIRPWSYSNQDLKGPGCKIPDSWTECLQQPLWTNERFRDSYDVYILEAANAYGIHPAFLKAIIHAESTMNPIGSETYPGPLTAMDPANRNLKLSGIPTQSYDLWLYPTKRPTQATALSSEYNTYHFLTHPVTHKVCEAFPYWSPRGQIWAAASYIRNLRTLEIGVDEKGIDGKKHRYAIDNLLLSDLRDPYWVHRARYLVAMYNKGGFSVEHAVDAYYQVHSQLPHDFGQAWNLYSEPRWRKAIFKEIDDPYTGKVIREEKAWELRAESYRVGKCHVWRVAGLCGEKPEGYFAEYYNDFVYDVKTAKWYRAHR